MAQAVDAIAHDVAHGAGVIVRPDGFGAVRLLGAEELLGDDIEGVIPRDLRKLARAFGASTAQRMQKPVRVMDALRVARDLFADHARRVEIVFGAADTADGPRVEDFDFKCAGRRTVVRTGRSADLLWADG